MKRIIIGLAIFAMLTGTATASSLPRFKLKPGMTQAQAITKTNRAVNRTEGFSGADCWLYDGNARIGWRHAACVGSFNAGGIVVRFKATFTPISCSVRGAGRRGA